MAIANTAGTKSLAAKHALFRMTRLFRLSVLNVRLAINSGLLTMGPKYARILLVFLLTQKQGIVKNVPRAIWTQRRDDVKTTASIV